MKRDPRNDPRERDMLRERSGQRYIIVDRVTKEEVAYRVTDQWGGLLAAYRTPLENWHRLAPDTCSTMQSN